MYDKQFLLTKYLMHVDGIAINFLIAVFGFEKRRNVRQLSDFAILTGYDFEGCQGHFAAKV